jgi:hypothetical protein
VDIFIDQPQPVENGERTERGLEKILRPGRHRRARREAEERAEQDAEGVEKCADHQRIVARLARKGNEEKFSFWPAGALDFRRVQTRFDFSPAVKFASRRMEK